MKYHAEKVTVGTVAALSVQVIHVYESQKTGVSDFSEALGREHNL